jgi:predicted RNA-binding protein (virulence factor B family)
MKEQNLFIKIGEINTLKVHRKSENGLYLQAKDDSEVLLPNIYVDESKMAQNSLIDVFIYTDSEDRIVATTLTPKAKVGEFGYFEVVDIKHYGAFVDWGLPKDLFVPLSQQKKHFEIGTKHILAVVLDEKSNRVYATQKIGRFLSTNIDRLRKKDKVEILIIAKTPMGYKVIVNNKYEGMIYHNEIFKPVKIGEKMSAYIKNIRKDKKLDLILQPIGKDNNDSDTHTILSKLGANGGSLDFTYKSDAKDIQEKFAMSKKSFKKALTKLIETNQIELLEDKIILKRKK